MKPRVLLLILLLGCGGGPAAAEGLRVGVAANFRDAFTVLSRLYAQSPAGEDQQPAAIYGSSGMLYAQITQGAPFDLFLSADRERPDRLAADGRTAGPVRTYARGRLALWMPGRRASPDALTGQRFSLANPQLAPYGAAARACLEHLGLWDGHVKDAVYGSNVSQTFHFVVSGAVPAGFVAYAQVLSRRVPATEVWLPPASCYPSIEQGAVVLKGERKAAAEAFLQFLLSDPAQQRLEAMGYARS